MAKHSANILEWARQGAEARWHQLQTELASLIDTFPHLAALSKRGRRAGRNSAALRGSATAASKGGAAGTATGGAARRKRPQMTAAQKKAVSLRMKKYWAERRKTAKA